MKKISIPVLFLGAAVAMSACDSKPTFKKYEGLEYCIYKDEPGDKHPQIGDFVEFHLKMKIDDSLIADTRRDQPDGKPVQAPLQESMRGDFWSGFKLMTPGDSAVFLVNIDSLFAEVKKKQPQAEIPPFLKGKKTMRYEIQLISVKSKEEAQKDQEAKMKEQEAKNAEQVGIDDKLISDYLAKNNITATKTASGLYYVITAPGSGDVIKTGQEAKVMYTGMTLDGKVFDSNQTPDATHKDPLAVTVGQGMVIRGWDEGLQLLKKGSKAKFFIPSGLAYGPQSKGPGIPANAVLVFDVEVIGVK